MLSWGNMASIASRSLCPLSFPVVRSSLSSFRHTTSYVVSPQTATCPIVSHHGFSNRHPSTSFSSSAVTSLSYCVPFRPSHILSVSPPSSSSSFFPKSVAKQQAGFTSSNSPVVSAALSLDETKDSEKERGEGEGKEENVSWEVKMLYDGDCPLCMREVDMLRERSKSHGNRICFVDIASSDYKPEENAGISFEVAMERIHAIEKDGRVMTDIAAFRRFYQAVDLGWIYAITTVQPLGALADALYGFWAKYRLPITGRPSLEVVMEERRRKREEGESCATGDRCRTS